MKSISTRRFLIDPNVKGALSPRMHARQHQSEANATIMAHAIDRVALGNCAVNCPIVEAHAAQHALVSLANIGAAVCGNVGNFRREAVLTPFPNIAGHVVNAEFIRRLLSDRLRAVAVPPVIPSHLVDVVAATEAKSVSPVGTAASRVLPTPPPSASGIGLGDSPLAPVLADEVRRR